jgi:hypothetical protein
MLRMAGRGGTLYLSRKRIFDLKGEILCSSPPLHSPSCSFFPMIVDYKRMSDLFDDNLQSMRAPSSVPYPSLSSLVRDDEEQIGPCFRASGYEFKPFYHF